MFVYTIYVFTYMYLGYNRRSLGVAFLGDWDEELPSNKAILAAKNLLLCGVELGELDTHYKLFGARQIISTESPGLALFQEIQEWPNYSESIPTD